MADLQFFDPKRELTIISKLLPRWAQAGTVSYITRRTSDSLPADVQERISHERQELLRTFGLDPVGGKRITQITLSHDPTQLKKFTAISRPVKTTDVDEPRDEWSRLLAENRSYISGEISDDEVNKVLLNCHFPDCATADRVLGQVSNEVAAKLRPVNEGFSSDSGTRRYHVAHEGRLSGREVKEYLRTVCKPGGGAIYEVLL